MRIFILEDDQERIQTFKEKLHKHELIFCVDATSAIVSLSNDMNYDLILLDHDLGGEIYVDSENWNTGTTVARFIKYKGFTGTICIHSMNQYGAEVMNQILPSARRTPFYYIFEVGLKKLL